MPIEDYLKRIIDELPPKTDITWQHIRLIENTQAFADGSDPFVDIQQKRALFEKIEVQLVRKELEEILIPKPEGILGKISRLFSNAISVENKIKHFLEVRWERMRVGALPPYTLSPNSRTTRVCLQLAMLLANQNRRVAYYFLMPTLERIEGIYAGSIGDYALDEAVLSSDHKVLRKKLVGENDPMPSDSANNQLACVIFSLSHLLQVHRVLSDEKIEKLCDPNYFRYFSEKYDKPFVSWCLERNLISPKHVVLYEKNITEDPTDDITTIAEMIYKEKSIHFCLEAGWLRKEHVMQYWPDVISMARHLVTYPEDSARSAYLFTYLQAGVISLEEYQSLPNQLQTLIISYQLSFSILINTLGISLEVMKRFPVSLFETILQYMATLSPEATVSWQALLDQVENDDHPVFQLHQEYRAFQRIQKEVAWVPGFENTDRDLQRYEATDCLKYYAKECLEAPGSFHAAYTAFLVKKKILAQLENLIEEINEYSSPCLNSSQVEKLMTLKKEANNVYPTFRANKTPADYFILLKGAFNEFKDQDYEPCIESAIPEENRITQALYSNFELSLLYEVVTEIKPGGQPKYSLQDIKKSLYYYTQTHYCQNEAAAWLEMYHTICENKLLLPIERRYYLHQLNLMFENEIPSIHLEKELGKIQVMFNKIKTVITETIRYDRRIIEPIKAYVDKINQSSSYSLHQEYLILDALISPIILFMENEEGSDAKKSAQNKIEQLILKYINSSQDSFQQNFYTLTKHWDLFKKLNKLEKNKIEDPASLLYFQEVIESSYNAIATNCYLDAIWPELVIRIHALEKPSDLTINPFRFFREAGWATRGYEMGFHPS